MPSKLPKKASSARQGFLASAGIDVHDVGVPFFKPSGRKTTIRITRVWRRDEYPDVKEFETDGGMQKLPIYCVLDVEVQGVPHVWEISSKRALAALGAIQSELPCAVDVQTKGSGTATMYLIQEPATNDRGQLSGARTWSPKKNAYVDQDGQVIEEGAA